VKVLQVGGMKNNQWSEVEEYYHRWRVVGYTYGLTVSNAETAHLQWRM